MDIPDTIPQDGQTLIQNLLDDKPPEFTDLTQTQYEAFNQGLLSEGNHLLVAHTGNGKTLCAEAVTRKAINNNKNVAYLVPSTSLVNDKHETIESWTPDYIDVEKRSGYTSANVMVATFESYFEAVIRGYSGRFDTVILDDFHEIYDENIRGPTIEKGISAALNQDCDILAISATIGNPEDVAEWLDADLTVSTEDRAVPIEEKPVEKTNDSYADQIHNIIQNNPEKGPFIIFCDTTRNVESRAIGIADRMSFETPKDIDFEQVVRDKISTELTDDHKDLIKALENGVGYHHSQMESELKEEIAYFAEQGIIKCVTATTSLSYGFNSPVQSVITADLRRYTRENGLVFIGKYEYVQMIGRAGRDASVYDQAYAFPMYDDEDADEYFQFDKSLEEKEIENVTTHLNGKEELRWLIAELINYGWETKEEVFEFISQTLYWKEAKQDSNDNNNETPEEISAKVKSQLEWLLDREIIEKQDPIGGKGLATYDTTEIGHAIVEYDHSNWFSHTIDQVHQLAKWLRTEIENETLTPEKLTQRLAQQYYHCEHNINIKNDDIVSKMNQYGLFNKPGQTAGAICWFWNQGFSISQIQDATKTSDLTRLPSTSYNLSTAIDSLSRLFEATTMPTQPDWLDVFETQLSTGVCGIDTYLINSTENFGRKRYNQLVQMMDKISDQIDEDPGEDYYLIERLYEFNQQKHEDKFKSMVQNAEGIGPKTALNLHETIETWQPENFDPVNVPYEHRTRKHEKSRFAEKELHEEDSKDETDEELISMNSSQSKSNQPGSNNKTSTQNNSKGLNASLEDYV